MKVEGEQQQEQPAGAEAPAAEQPGSVQPSQASDEEVKQKLLVLLGNSDLTTTTEKMLRKQLEKELGVDLSSKKALIRQEVLDYLEKHQPEEEEEEEAADEEEEEEEEQPKASKKRGGGGFGGLCVLSEPLQAFVGEETMIRTQIVKKIWDYIKEKDLQDPKDRRQIRIDEKLGTIFKKPLTMFSMNKQLTNHIFKTSEVRRAAGSDSDADSDGDDDDEPAPKRKPAKRQRKAADEEGGSSRKGTGFGKPLPLSDEFAAACGKPAMNRGEISKWLFAYCNEHDLKDPKDRRWANCDETLKKLTGEKRIKLFGGQKYFSKHIVGK